MDTSREYAALEDQDESVRIAVRALGDMRNGAPTSPSFQPTPALSVTSRSTSPSIPEEESPDFVSRVSRFPVVNSALRVYEHGKASSRVVKYGAEMMESSMKTISRPVINKLPVNQLDEFACRQLDRLGNYRRRPSSPEVSRGRDPVNEESETDRSQSWTQSLRDMSISRGRTRELQQSPQSDRDLSMARPEEPHSRTPTPRQGETSPDNERQVAQRSRWQAVLLEAGGIGAAFSEESMRRLKYCLHWLQYATAHIDSQILALRDFISSLQTQPSSSSSSSPTAEQQLQTLTSIRRDVVDTIRQVVDVVSKYAGGALPEPARARVRSFILCLPQRWAHAATITFTGPVPANGAANQGTTDGADGSRLSRTRGRTAPYSYGPGEAGPSPRSRPASRATSPSSLRTHHAHGRQAGTHAPTTGTAAQAAQKILTLATESLDMLRAVTGVFKESLDKADAWVERLRVIGVQRQNSSAYDGQDGQDQDSDQGPTLPPVSSLDAYRDPPVVLTPGSSRAHSPTSPFTQVHLAPLDPARIAIATQQNGNNEINSPGYFSSHMHPYCHSWASSTKPNSETTHLRGGSGAGEMMSLDTLTLNGANAKEGPITPKGTAVVLPPEGDGGGGRSGESDKGGMSTALEEKSGGDDGTNEARNRGGFKMEVDDG